MKTSAATVNRDRAKFRASQIVVGLQTSLCLMLLIGAGLLVRSMRNLETADLGMRTSGLLVFGLNLQGIHSGADGARFFEALLNRLQAVPGVDSATVLLERIGAGGSWNNGGFRIDGVNPSPEGHARFRWNACGAGCMHVLGIPVLLGRDLAAEDALGAPRVVIVDESFVKKYLNGRNPIGHRIKAGGNIGRDESTIIGVAANSKYTSVREEAKPTAYFPYTQIQGISTMQVEVRTSGNPEAMLGSLSRTVREFAPDLPLLQPMSQREVFESESAVSTGRLLARLSGFFGVLAVVLVATGLYGTLAYMVARRTTEVGLRMALGARRGQVLWMILRQSLAMSLAGTAVGVPLAIAGTRLLKSMLFGLSPSDLLTFAAALAGLFAITLIASLIPARRAASVDPIVALRYE
jgi:predicted permease